MAHALVEVDTLRKTFPGGRHALDGLTLTVPPGRIYALLGPNGAGKTTLVRVLATLVPPDAGTARVAGFDVRRQPDRVRALIGLAGQHAAVDEVLTGRENVELVGRLYGLPGAEARRRGADVLARIGLGEVADRQVGTYSGGLRRRLDLAASLVGRPALLLLDEPTTGVDPASRIELWRFIAELVAGGTTVLLTTQNLDEADRLADRIAVIDHGRLVAEGTADELKDRVGGAVLELSVPDADRSRAMRALAGSGEPAVTKADGTIRLPAPDGPRSLTAAMRRLAEAGIEPRDVLLHRPTLDDVFLVLTGHRPTSPALDPASAGQPAPSADGRAA